jgi:hypothetical protein
VTDFSREAEAIFAEARLLWHRLILARSAGTQSHGELVWDATIPTLMLGDLHFLF